MLRHKKPETSENFRNIIKVIKKVTFTTLRF